MKDLPHCQLQFIEETVRSYTVTIYLAGSIVAAKQALREFCYSNPLCVTVREESFIYTAGLEDGVAVTLQNYPRFPKTFDTLKSTALILAKYLIERLYQRSALVVCPDETVWVTTVPPSSRV